MDIETAQELRRLQRDLRATLDDLESAGTDDERFAAWRNVQTLGWELNALLPAGRT